MFYCENNKKRQVVETLERMGARVESFKFIIVPSFKSFWA